METTDRVVDIKDHIYKSEASMIFLFIIRHQWAPSLNKLSLLYTLNTL